MTEHLKHAIATNLGVARSRAKLSQEALAERAGLSVESISKIERGLQFPRLESLAQLCAALEIAVADLFVEIDPRRAPSPERQRLDAEYRYLGRNLSNADLRMAVEILEAIARRERIA